ncbi:TIM barrel protein [Methanomassiliicoccus luminyensis]|jgi:deoxyribonuclease-4|uniref:TIM barrel protein n=1 Tax=Methanomassiliicoccus luminyensis TaxID=1080712 RepID=UPI000370F820|nr:TIM barrel protein [Methanomassiliicoccus luminyensis]
MLYVGPAGYPPGSKGAVQAVENVKALGLNALEVQFGRGVNLSDERALELGIRAKGIGVALSAHAPYYINFNSDAAGRAKSEDWLLRSLRAATLFGGRIVVVHAASYMGTSSEKATAAVVEGVRAVRKVMENEGLTPAIGLETMGKTGSWGTLEEIAAVMKEVDGVEPVVDFAHIHARRQGCLRTAEDFRAALDEWLAIHPGRLHCHFSCIEYTAKGEKRHLLLESRDPDFAHLAPLLPKCSRDVTVISETPDPSGDAVRMREMLEQ